MKITLAPLRPDAQDQVRHLEARSDQLDFVAPIDQMLGEPTPSADFHGIWRGDDAVGFFKTDPPGMSFFDFVAADAIGLGALLVGAQYQGKGYGGAAMAALPACLTAQYDAPRAMLSVDDNNPVARRLYLAYGWIQTGAVHDARTGPAPVMQLTL